MCYKSQKLMHFNKYCLCLPMTILKIYGIFLNITSIVSQKACYQTVFFPAKLTRLSYNGSMCITCIMFNKDKVTGGQILRYTISFRKTMSNIWTFIRNECLLKEIQMPVYKSVFLPT